MAGTVILTTLYAFMEGTGTTVSFPQIPNFTPSCTLHYGATPSLPNQLLRFGFQGIQRAKLFIDSEMSYYIIFNPINLLSPDLDISR
jgi:hypothetical protein